MHTASTIAAHPRDVLQDAQAGAVVLPVCDHYSGVEARMRKSLQLQAQMHQEFGVCVFDVTFDCEDGAPVGGEHEHAHLVAELVQSADANARVAVRVHPVDHPCFHADVQTIVGRAASRLCHVMLPKVESSYDVDLVARHLRGAGGAGGVGAEIGLALWVVAPASALMVLQVWLSWVLAHGIALYVLPLVVPGEVMAAVAVADRFIDCTPSTCASTCTSFTCLNKIDRSICDVTVFEHLVFVGFLYLFDVCGCECLGLFCKAHTLFAFSIR